MWKKFLLVLLGLFVFIQFIRPKKNEGNLDGPNDIAQVLQVPEEVKTILHASCYDCHSNRTQYPLYSRIMPFGWWLNHHIEEGKEHLNFSEFGSYSKEKQDHKLEETEEEVKEGEMPLSSYTFIHGEAKLSKEQVALLTDWVEKTRKELELN